MAIPTISSVSPNYALFIGGHAVEVTGTGFSLASDSFEFDYEAGDSDEVYSKVAGKNPPLPTPKPPNLVRLQLVIGDVTHEVEAYVTSDTSLWFNMPRLMPQAAAWDINYTETADLVVTNLDEDGDPIDGETVTVEDAIQIRLAKTGKSETEDNSYLITRITTGLKRQLQAYVLPNTTLVPHRDFATVTETTIRASTPLPALALMGPEVQESRLGTKKAQILYVTDLDENVYNLGSVEVSDLVYELFILDNSSRHGSDLIGVLEYFYKKTPYVSYNLFTNPAFPTKWVSNVLWDRHPVVDVVPTQIPDSIRQIKARLRITSVPRNLTNDVLMQVIAKVPAYQRSSLVFQASASAEDTQPQNSPGILEE